MKNIEYCSPVEKFFSLGGAYFNDEAKWLNYLEMGISKEHIPELMSVIREQHSYDMSVVDGENPHIWAYVHAWRALGQLKDKSAIEPLIGIFEQYYDDDYVHEDLPIVMKMIGEEALTPLGNYMLSTKKRAHSIAAKSITQIALSIPSLRERSINYFTQYLDNTNENFADEDVAMCCGFIVSNLLDLEAKEAIESIRSAFQRGVVDEYVMGDIEDMEIQFGFRTERATVKKPNPLFEEIRRITRYDHSDKPPKYPYKLLETDDFYKLGRNEPYHCGSGKKYKKCCLK